MTAAAYRLFLPFFLAFYIVAGFMTHSRFGGREIFPLFSWALYIDAPRREVQYTARLLETAGQAPGTPIDLMATPGFHRSPDYHLDVGVLGQFGAALDAGDRDRAAALRRLVEVNILPADCVRYDMVKRIFDPLERRASGRFTETVLEVFVKEGEDGVRR